MQEQTRKTKIIFLGRYLERLGQQGQRKSSLITLQLLHFTIIILLYVRDGMRLYWIPSQKSSHSILCAVTSVRTPFFEDKAKSGWGTSTPLKYDYEVKYIGLDSLLFDAMLPHGWSQ